PPTRSASAGVTCPALATRAAGAASARAAAHTPTLRSAVPPSTRARTDDPFAAPSAGRDRSPIVLLKSCCPRPAVCGEMESTMLHSGWIGALAVVVVSSASPGETPARANRLARESSPYLRQHAHNPVDWFPWGPEAFAKAKSENK